MGFNMLNVLLPFSEDKTAFFSSGYEGIAVSGGER
jgi:hypothetical protein